MAAVLALTLAGCTQSQLRGYMPGEPGVTNHTDRITGLWATSWQVLMIVGIITWGLTLWVAIAYRRRKGQSGLPVQLRYNMPIEILYTVIPLILVLGFFAFTARDQAAIEQPTDNPDVRVEVFAKRWAWDFNYVDEGPGGEGVHTMGIQAQENEDDDSMDIEKFPELVLPVGKTVEVRLESRDVAHSFWVIDFLYKKDTIPGKTNYMYFTPQKEGVYAGKCAEFCGEYHGLMLFNVRVVSQAEYDNYIQDLVDAGQTGIRGTEYNANTNQPDNKAPERRG